MRRYVCVLVVALFVALCPLWAGAQGEAQVEPVAVTLESYLVTTVTLDDGTTEERFSSAETATPGEVLEYRLAVQNQSGETLPEGLALTGPVPSEVQYFPSATPAEAARLEFSADGGETFAEPPVMIMVTNEEGEEEEVVADPSQYNAVRWLLLTPLAPEASMNFRYRVTVR